MIQFHIACRGLDLSALNQILPSVTIFHTGTPTQTSRISFKKVEQNCSQQAANYVHSLRK